MSTNVDGKRKVPFALTAIRGLGRRFTTLACKKAGVNVHKRAGELKPAEIDKVLDVIAKPEDYKIPRYFLNRQRDWKEGNSLQATSTVLDSKIRDDLDRLKKIRNHRGLRHYWNLRVRGQHTCTTGRHGNVRGVIKKK